MDQMEFNLIVGDFFFLVLDNRFWYGHNMT